MTSRAAPIPAPTAPNRGPRTIGSVGTFRRLLGFLRPYRRLWTISFVTYVLYAAITLTITVPEGSLNSGVVYDYLRLELDETA